MLDLLTSLVEEILGCKSHICSRWLTAPISRIFSKRKIPATNIHLETPPVFTPATLLVPTHCFTWTWVPASVQIEYACECKVQVHGSECHWAPELVQKWTTKTTSMNKSDCLLLVRRQQHHDHMWIKFRSAKENSPIILQYPWVCVISKWFTMPLNKSGYSSDHCLQDEKRNSHRAYRLACDITDQVFRTSMVVILNGQCWAVSSPDSCTRLCAREEMESNLLPETLVACHQHSPCDDNGTDFIILDIMCRRCWILSNLGH